MKDILVILIVALILGLAVWYVIRAKKKGARCVGCPHGGACSRCMQGVE